MTTAMRERCPSCDLSDSVTIRDLQKCLNCGATWVTGSGLPVRDRTGIDEARQNVIEEAVELVPELVRDGRISENAPLALAIKVLHQAMMEFYS